MPKLVAHTSLVSLRSIAAAASVAVAGTLVFAACAADPTRVPSDLNPDDASIDTMLTLGDTGQAIEASTFDFGGDAPPKNCGDGVLTSDEACDDGNKVSNDGCDFECLHVEPGWLCPTPGKPCIPFVACGDGVVSFPEQCDDGNVTAGDGCSPTCHIEIGYKCSGTPKSACSPTTCGDGKVEGAEACDDGNATPFDGCSSTCQTEPDCSAGACTSKCGDGIVLGSEQCDDGNTTNGDGCSSTCQSELGYTCSTDTTCEKVNGACVLRVPAVYHDFVQGADPDFFVGCDGLVTGMVQPLLDAQAKPVLASPGTACTSTQANFANWYRTSSHFQQVGSIVLFDNGAGGFVNRFKDDGSQFAARTNETWASNNAADCAAAGCQPCSYNPAQGCNATVVKYDGNPLFFPLDSHTGETFQNAKIPAQYGYPSWPWESSVFPGAKMHNFGFTTEVEYWFKYDSSKSAQLVFTGDDDVWVFINGHLAVDLGGTHVPLDGTVTIDSTSTTKFGLTNGSVYRINVFQAERKPEGSSFRLTLAGFSTSKSECAPVCGDGKVEFGEQCDDGMNMGGYGKCGAGCKLGPRCGDGIVQMGEDCDDGKAGSACVSAGCHVLTIR